MITIAELRQKWNDMPIFENGFVRINETHPLEVYIGHEELDQKTLMVVDTNKADELPSSRSIIAKNFQRADGRWAISFRLIHQENEDVFIMLCWDMIEASRTSSNTALKQLLKRYKNWQKLLERQHSEVMDTVSQKGLLGELLFLEEFINKADCCKAIESWVGPDAADQDFIFDNTWAEIKSISVSAEAVSISSLEQLACAEPGSLVVYYLEKTSSTNTSAFSLAGKINEIRTRLADCAEAREKFKLKLFQYGYRDLKEYAQDYYCLRGKHIFNVMGDFPRLTKENVAKAVVSAKYAISLAAIASYEQVGED